MELQSLWLASKIFPKLSVSLLLMNGMVSPDRVKRYFSCTRPFFSTNDLDLLALKLIRPHVMSFSRPWRILLVPATDAVVMVRTSV